MRYALLILLSLFFRASDPGDTLAVLHSIYQMNTDEERLDSHESEWQSSVLEQDFNYNIEIPISVLKAAVPIYTRIKRLPDGSYLLLYHDTRLGGNCYMSKSSDLKNWSDGEKLFSSRHILSSVGEDVRKYMNPDAVVLSNGDVLAVAAFRAAKAYRKFPVDNGIVIRRSHDSGKTWEEEQTIYTGTNWEPYILELPDGTLQCYFTDGNPAIYTKNKLGDSGSSIIVSMDGGITWSPSDVSNTIKVIRQYKYDNEGVRIYTDQMPCARMLNDGHTLAAIVEARLEDDADDKTSIFKMSLAYAQDEWPEIKGEEEGPADRQTNIFDGAAGYIDQFPSGETVISCNINSVFSMKVGDSKARNFNQTSWDKGWFEPFPKTGYWGSIEVCGSHDVLAAMHSKDTTSIQIARMVLNHRIDAPKANITLDGCNGDWKHTCALFIGSESPVQAIFRAASDKKYLYLMVECADAELSAEDNIKIMLRGGKGGEISINANGLRSSSIKGLSAVSKQVMGGYLCEIKVPLKTLSLKDNNIRMNAILSDTEWNSKDTFTGADINNPDTWMSIITSNN